MLREWIIGAERERETSAGHHFLPLCNWWGVQDLNIGGPVSLHKRSLSPFCISGDTLRVFPSCLACVWANLGPFYKSTHFFFWPDGRTYLPAVRAGFTGRTPPGCAPRHTQMDFFFFKLQQCLSLTWDLQIILSVYSMWTLGQRK